MERRVSPTRATVLLAWELGGGLGHCVKLAPLAAALVERGFEVYFAARDVATAQRVLRNAAVKYLQAPCLVTKSANFTRRPRSFAQVLEQVGFGDEGQLRALVTAWRHLFELVRPSVLVCEHSPTALLASRGADVRRIAIGTGFSLPPDVSPLPDLCPWMAAPLVGFVEQERSIVARLNQLLAADGLAPLERLSQLYADVDASFLMTFRELDHHAERGAVRHGGTSSDYLGSWSLPGGIAPEWPAGNGPRVFAYLKSQGGPFRLEAAIAVLRELPIQTLAYVPRASMHILGMQTPTLRICTEPVDMRAALARCDLAILNGTSGTATRAYWPACRSSWCRCTWSRSRSAAASCNSAPG